VFWNHRCPGRLCSCPCLCTAARWSSPIPPYLAVLNTTALGALLVMPILGSIAFKTGFCRSSHSLKESVMAGVPYDMLGM
jgi:hypothetical protein